MQSGSRVSACDKSIRTAVTSAYFINDNFDLLKLKLTNIASLQAAILSPISIKYTAKVFEGGYQTPSATPSLCSVPSCVRQTWHGRLGDTVNFGNFASPWLFLYFKTQENNFYLMKENEKLCLQKMQIGNVV